MFTKILIANRGEIACRVAATARRLGIQTVAVYSEADAHAKHVAMCDEAVLIGPSAARDSYLKADVILAVALATGAQAIHPGYGFLSENAAFARSCETAGIVFIGPPASAIDAMGSKSAAKTLMEQADVPLVPGYHGERQDADFLHTQADSMGYPVLLKASAGGGGKGMRIVEKSADFKDALVSCKREAISSFGDDKVLVEKYLNRPRHIEIQVFADQQGECVYLFERDCSVQRRHQKVLEEAPAPGMSDQRRSAMGHAAVTAAKAVSYVGAGTVEFIVNQDGAFYFMEMNTRLQVEHPVTEMISGTDLVEWQLRVAAGEPLPLTQAQLQINGHAIEARIYAENPDKGFLPSIGILRHVRTPSAVTFTRNDNPDNNQPVAVRIDSGVREGDTISPFYDPMIAKLIVWGATRAEALARMAQALAEYQVVGVATNIAFLQRLIGSTAFSTADLDTGLIERNQEVLFPPTPVASLPVLALASAALLDAEQRTTNAANPWSATTGWRLNSVLQRAVTYANEAQHYALHIGYHRTHYTINTSANSAVIRIVAQKENDQTSGNAGKNFTLTLDGQTVRGTVVREADTFHIFTAGTHTTLVYTDPMAHAGEAEIEGGRLTAPMPGKIVAIHVRKGNTVEQGAPLLVMEAMKMEHTISAPGAGVIEEILFEVGDQVADGTQLLRLVAQ
ncbi:acetyl/propionyl/methylcrotonyl-CoA carboxylase subunit alpha [Glaciimonas sp. PCH181]|uniref:acetyl/propionyl/methylcrotonyl-CoA carboxylase subunit alpha n=1 Tax=Glaciimonas sp. PCH181 TaxID=2133943 RepID=UPI000D3C70B3|nr:acetyl/propionyl/methylcrotonyl-CoA carboxylase subunit alpha [Glaciimonas sp. PCH181]PUA20344.1 3-methylcrotonyl-CoA carboxylase [Glaciimonas sp. PCH181]